MRRGTPRGTTYSIYPDALMQGIGHIPIALTRVLGGIGHDRVVDLLVPVH